MTSETDALFEAMGRERADVRPREEGEHPGIDRTRWGLYRDVDPVSYFSGFIPEITISQSQIGKAINETMLDFAYAHPQITPDAEKVAATVAMRRGDVVHQLALGKGRGYAVLDVLEFRSNADKALRDNAIAQGLTPIKRKDFEAAEVMADLLKSLIEETLEGRPYETEVVFLYQEMSKAGPIWVRGMIDVLSIGEDDAWILDPKVTPNIYNSSVDRHILNMGWDRQGALYPHAVGKILPHLAGKVKFRDLMVKPTEPFTHRVVAIDKSWEYSAIKECVEAFERFGECLYSGRWPGFEQTYFAQLPGWEAKRREAAELGGGA